MFAGFESKKLPPKLAGGDETEGVVFELDILPNPANAEGLLF